jgi:rfaE bifunctional protein nucleotidyltransferase chain/domain
MKKKIISYFEAEKIIKTLKSKGKKIVHCHGVFDLLHVGHIKHFESAKKLGDILIISVTPDKFVQKGFNRPYFNSDQRIQILASIGLVDFVVLNRSVDAVDIINKIKPNIYCKGPDYKNFNDDITGQIKKESAAVKKNYGKLMYTNDPVYSSSSILNQLGDIYNSEQKNFLHKIKSKININSFNRHINKLKNLKVLVVGESIIDNYVFCEALGKSGKEPHLVLRDLKEEIYPGGVIAIARNISDFCKNITILSALGQKKEYENFIKKNLHKNIKTLKVEKISNVFQDDVFHLLKNRNFLKKNTNLIYLDPPFKEETIIERANFQMQQNNFSSKILIVLHRNKGDDTLV